MSDERMFAYPGMDFEALGRAYHSLMPDHVGIEPCAYAYLDRDILNKYFSSCTTKPGVRWTLYTAALLREYGCCAQSDWELIRRRAKPCSSTDYFQFGLLVADAIIEMSRHDPTGKNIQVEPDGLSPSNLSMLTGGMRDSVRPIN